MTSLFTCVSVLGRTRYITIVAILIQWDANKWQVILQFSFKFSLCFTRECKAICKENLAVYQKSLGALFQAPLQNNIVLMAEINMINRQKVYINNRNNFISKQIYLLHCICVTNSAGKIGPKLPNGTGPLDFHPDRRINNNYYFFYPDGNQEWFKKNG